MQTVKQLREKDKELRLRAARLRRQLVDLEKEAREAGILQSTPPATDPLSPAKVVTSPDADAPS